MQISFSESGYIDLINQFLNSGYKVVDFSTVEEQSRHLIVRHDIDMCMKRAARMAEIESEIGISATYYVLLRTHLYNINAPEHAKALNHIISLGHRVGLHFDASIYGDDLNVLNNAARNEAQHLENIIKTPVETISFHRPAPMLQGLEGLFAGRSHAYEPRFFKTIGYCSDSRGEFRFGYPTEQKAFMQKTAMQLLIHPIWWIGSQTESAIDKLERLVDENTQFLKAELGRNCIPYSKHLASMGLNKSL